MEKAERQISSLIREQEIIFDHLFRFFIPKKLSSERKKKIHDILFVTPADGTGISSLSTIHRYVLTLNSSRTLHFAFKLPDLSVNETMLCNLRCCTAYAKYLAFAKIIISIGNRWEVSIVSIDLFRNLINNRLPLAGKFEKKISVSYPYRNDIIDSVSYTHLTLPTIYSV